MTITTIGEVLMDMTQTFVDDTGVTHFAAIPGGAPLNVAVVGAKLGVETLFIGCVGDDTFGRQLRATMAKWGVRTDALQVTQEASTTLAIVTVDDQGERSFSFCRRPGADTRLDQARAVEAAAQADLLHFGSVSLSDPQSRQTVLSAVRAAKKAGALITYDPNYRASLWPDEETAIWEMRAPLPLCDIVKISDEETTLLTGEADPRKAAEILLAQGVKLAVVTLGAKGAYWRCGDLEGTQPGRQVKVADTNGAGDTFFGSFLTRIVKRGGLEGITADELNDFVRYANLAASITTSRPGAIPAMPTLAEMEAALQA